MKPHLTAVPRRLGGALADPAEDFKFTVLSAEAGWGKTAVVQEVLRTRPHCCVPVRPDRTPRFSSREPLVVLDDFQNLSPRLEERMAGIFRRSPKRQRFFLLSRGPLPGFLLPCRYAGELRLFQSEDLRLDPEGIALLASERGLALPAREVLGLEAETGGYPPLVCALLDAMAAGGGLGPRERDAGAGEVRVEAEQLDETTYAVNVLVDLLDADGESVVGLESWSFPYVFVEDRWVFTEFQMVY